MFEIIPGILEKEWSEIEKKLEIIKTFTNTVHIDILDGKFANNSTFLDPKPFASYSNNFFFEVHMMIENPLEYLKPFADAGFKRFLGHIEKMPDPVEFVAQAQILGEVGLAVDGKTSIDVLHDFYDNLDCALIMTINAGFSGQEFMPDLLSKVKVARQHTDEFIETSQAAFFPIEVDGGVNEQTILDAKAAGATRFVATSALFQSNNPKQAFENLLKKVHE